MTTLLEQVEVMLQGIIDKRVSVNTIELRAQLIRTRRELEDARLYGDAVTDERDQARAELVGVAAQRDAHLSRSVELAARVTELEAAWFAIQVELWGNGHKATSLESVCAGIQSLRASWDKTLGERNELKTKLAAATLAVAEVDGFRVGDLVRNLLSAPGIAWGTVTRVGRHVEVTYPTNREAIAYKPDELCRKPVEVGDTVRVKGMGRGKALRIEGGGNEEPYWHVKLDDDRDVLVCHVFDVVAVAP